MLAPEVVSTLRPMNLNTLATVAVALSLLPACGMPGSDARNEVKGDVGGGAMTAVSSVAKFGPALPDEAFVSISIGDWAQTCAQEPGCPGAAVNFTLYVKGGAAADLKPGTYSVVGERRNGFSYEVVGGAGRYDAQCSTGAGFSTFKAGTVTLDSLGSRATGSFTFTTEDAGTLSGRFDALGCR